MKLFRWLWELPQCLLGSALIGYYKLFKNLEYKETYKGIRIYSGDFPGGISLGLFIIMSSINYKYNRNYTKEHEYGHTVQSLYLGPLYLIVIGLPSILWAGFIHDMFFPKKSYYWAYPERWADKLGKVPIKRWDQIKRY